MRNIHSVSTVCLLVFLVCIIAANYGCVGKRTNRTHELLKKINEPNIQQYFARWVKKYMYTNTDWQASSDFSLDGNTDSLYYNVDFFNWDLLETDKRYGAILLSGELTQPNAVIFKHLNNTRCVIIYVLDIAFIENSLFFRNKGHISKITDKIYFYDPSPHPM